VTAETTHALDDAAANAGDDLIVVYPGPASTDRVNPRGAYYENLIINSPLKLQGVGPGGVQLATNTTVPGSIIDGGAFAGDSPVATDWYTRIGLETAPDAAGNAVPTWGGNATIYDGAAISLYLPVPADVACNAAACRKAIKASGAKPEQVVGIGVDFTACTMLPVLRDGTPLCLMDRFQNAPLAWPKLWKHHGAKAETDRINQVAQERKEKWLARYGGTIGLEWFFPKVMQILDEAPEIYNAADRLIEAADWITWQLTGVETRNNTAAGYKALWSKREGYPPKAFFKALDPRLENIVEEKLSAEIKAIGQKAGELTEEAARWTGLKPGTAVAVANVDAHVAVPASTVTEAGRMVIIFTIAGAAGFLLSSAAGGYHLSLPLFHGAEFTVGASASIMGLLGALVHYGRRLSTAVYSQAIMYAVVLFVFGLAMQGVDNFAHAGGFAGGYLASVWLNPLKPERQEHLIGAVVCLLAVAVSVIASVVLGLPYVR
jgi:hypothetical protein